MANAAVASWKVCITLLQQLVHDPTTAPDRAKQAVDKLEGDWDCPLPNVASKRLVQDVQVRL
jgi:hypothetical protein